MIEKIQTQIQEIEVYISKYTTSELLSNIEIDIVLEKTRTMYDLLLQLKSQHTNKASHIAKIETESIIIEEPTEEVVHIDAQKAEESIGEEIANSAIETIEHTEIKETQILEPTEEKPEEPIIVQEQITQAPQKPTILDDTPKASQIKHDVGTKLAKKPISNISSAIGINERFQFIKELFKNDATVYNATITVLNSLPDFAAAMQYVSNHFEWDMENATVQRFVSIVERRYL